MQHITKKIPLKKIPNTIWDIKFQRVTSDRFIKKKYNRNRRLTENLQYINKYLPEVKKGKGFILDIGPGPGEFLEICRYFGNKIIGIDAKYHESEMGDKYMKLSKLLTARQKVPVQYVGFETFLKNNHSLPFKDKTLTAINSRGSIEQVFKDHMLGRPVREHKKAILLSWNINKNLLKKVKYMFLEANRVLKTGGIFLIHGNGAANVKEYHKMIMKVAKETGFVIERTEHHRLHRMRKK